MTNEPKFKPGHRYHIAQDLFFSRRAIVEDIDTREFVGSYDNMEEARIAHPELPIGPDIDYAE